MGGNASRGWEGRPRGKAEREAQREGGEGRHRGEAQRGGVEVQRQGGKARRRGKAEGRRRGKTEKEGGEGRRRGKAFQGINMHAESSKVPTLLMTFDTPFFTGIDPNTGQWTSQPDHLHIMHTKQWQGEHNDSTHQASMALPASSWLDGDAAGRLGLLLRRTLGHHHALHVRCRGGENKACHQHQGSGTVEQRLAADTHDKQITERGTLPAQPPLHPLPGQDASTASTAAPGGAERKGKGIRPEAGQTGAGALARSHRSSHCSCYADTKGQCSPGRHAPRWRRSGPPARLQCGSAAEGLGEQALRFPQRASCKSTEWSMHVTPVTPQQ